MSPRRLGKLYFIGWMVSLSYMALLLSSPLAAEPGQFIVSTVVEKKLNALPPGPLYWQIENFPALDEAESASAASPTSLAAAVSGKVWLFTLGQKGGMTPGGTKVAEIGPVPVFAAPEYLLRINHAGGPTGSKTPVHSHPGSESFYVLAGQVSQRTPHGVNRTDAGQSMVGHGPDMPMEVSSSGTTDLDQLVMFLLDATKPASVPAKFVVTDESAFGRYCCKSRKLQGDEVFANLSNKKQSPIRIASLVLAKSLVSFT